ncbi:MAG: cupin domain-containing protein [Actinobacteria bacterium]|nr:cupin domain-containing protein [Actinomycetota bacterium]
MSLHRDFDLQPLSDLGDVDDWRPNSVWSLASDERAEMAVIVEEIGVGDAIPLHVHSIDEVLLYQSGKAEVRVDDETHHVRAGDIVVVPAGTSHGTRNMGSEVVRLHAVFPSHRIDIQYLERNPAPGTEGDDPQPGVIWDTRTGAVEPL